jgi:fumarate reductase subunit D
MKRSNEPVFWSLFGAGGMLSALIGVALVFITGIGVPLGLWLSPDLMSYANMLDFARGISGKIIILCVIALFLWHAMLRILHLLHDFGIPSGGMVRVSGYGFTLLCTLLTAYWLLVLGF